MKTSVTTNQKLIDTLLLNASFIDNIGLMHGKMGISIFFFHLARQTENKIYEEYAGELIDEIYEDISVNTRIDFENGLAGIGWGIEYLAQNGFIEADTDEVLEEFDRKIFKELIYNTPSGIGLLQGIVGLGAYLLKRIQNPFSNDENISTLTNKHTLIHIIDEVDRRTQEIESRFNNRIQDDTLSTKNKSNFDITWDYTTLIWFLSELYEQNIFNFKVEKIIQRFIVHLSGNVYCLKLQSHRLLLAMALTKLIRTINSNQKTDKQKKQSLDPLNIKNIIVNLLIGIDRNIIKSEFSLNSVSIRYGMPGIAWIYKRLFKLTLEGKFKEEYVFWAHQNLLTEQEDKNSDERIKNMDNLGLLEGCTGNLLICLIENTQNCPCKK